MLHLPIGGQDVSFKFFGPWMRGEVRKWRKGKLLAHSQRDFLRSPVARGHGGQFVECGQDAFIDLLIL